MDNVKAIFLDMDGTILHKNNRVDSETADVIAQLRSFSIVQLHLLFQNLLYYFYVK